MIVILVDNISIYRSAEFEVACNCIDITGFDRTAFQYPDLTSNGNKVITLLSLIELTIYEYESANSTGDGKSYNRSIL